MKRKTRPFRLLAFPVSAPPVVPPLPASAAVMVLWLEAMNDLQRLLLVRPGAAAALVADFAEDLKAARLDADLRGAP